MQQSSKHFLGLGRQPCMPLPVSLYKFHRPGAVCCMNMSATTYAALACRCTSDSLWTSMTWFHPVCTEYCLCESWCRDCSHWLPAAGLERMFMSRHLYQYSAIACAKKIPENRGSLQAQYLMRICTAKPKAISRYDTWAANWMQWELSRPDSVSYSTQHASLHKPFT